MGPQDPNPGLPSTLHLRTAQGMTGKITNTDSETRTPELGHPARYQPSEQAPREPPLLQPGSCCPWGAPSEPAAQSPEGLRGGRALLGIRFDFLTQSNRVKSQMESRKGEANRMVLFASV